MSDLYERAPERGDGLRLHLNENTAGCSPRVLAAMRELGARDASFYPDYGATSRACAAWLGVPEDEFILTNGLDEGIYTAAIAWLQRPDDGPRPEAIVIEPAYALFAASAALTGARIVRVGPGPDLAFPLAGAIQAVSAATRIVFLASPANPSGMAVSRDEIRALAARLPDLAVLFLDEAYADFAREDFLAARGSCSNVIVGRTFSKAYGLAAVRAGYLVGAPPLIERVRGAILPFSVNAYALAAVRAAIGDPEYTKWYVGEVRASRIIVYESCERLGLKYWPSEANFVLVRVGPGAADLVEAMAARGVFVRDRSGLAGCGGTIRITTGVVDHTKACVAVLEELCAAR